MNVELSEVTLDVEVSGEGPAVLLVHGFPDSHRLWRHQIPALNAAGFTTVAPTLRGFGASSRPEGGPEAYDPAKHVGDLLELLARLELDRVHMVGHDWGSGIVQGLAQFVPERVASATLMSVGSIAAILRAGWEQRQALWHITMFQHEGLAEEWLSRDDHANLRAMLSDHPDAAEVLEPLLVPGGLTAALSVYRAGLPIGLQLGPVPELPPLTVPVMGVVSTGDPYLGERQMADTGAYVSGPWRFERIEDAGHWFPLERPEKVNELLLSFLKDNG